MDLDFAPRSLGRAARPASAEIVRELGEADLAMLELDRGVKPTSIKRLRDAHHSLARCIAQGLSLAEVSAITGYSFSRISILKGDPAFSELVSFYSSNIEETKDAIFADGLTRLQAVRDEAVEILHDRLLEEPEKFANEDLLDVVKTTADRTGLGPSSKSTNVNVNIDLADRIARGRRRVDQLASARPALVECTSATGAGVPLDPAGDVSPLSSSAGEGDAHE